MTSKAVHAAIQLLDQYAIDDPTDVPIEDLIQAQGAIYDEKPMHGAEGRIIFGPKSASVVINSRINSPEKRRFVKAHELGHLTLHRGQQPFFRCDDSAFLDWHRAGSHESEANLFASELLMPTNLFRQQANNQSFSVAFVVELARLFQTSLTATAIRYTQLGPEPVALFWSRRGVVQWRCRSDEFFARYLRKAQTFVHPHSMAHQFFRHGTRAVPTAPQLVLPEVWLDDRRVPNDLLFYEDCFPMPRLEAALSFIWMSNEYCN